MQRQPWWPTCCQCSAGRQTGRGQVARRCPRCTAQQPFASRSPDPPPLLTRVCGSWLEVAVISCLLPPAQQSAACRRQPFLVVARADRKGGSASKERQTRKPPSSYNAAISRRLLLQLLQLLLGIFRPLQLIMGLRQSPGCGLGLSCRACQRPPFHSWHNAHPIPSRSVGRWVCHGPY